MGEGEITILVPQPLQKPQRESCIYIESGATRKKNLKDPVMEAI